MRKSMRLHLVNGTVLDAAPDEVNEDELTLLKSTLEDYASSSAAWELSLQMASGSYIIVPGKSVLYMEIVDEDV